MNLARVVSSQSRAVVVLVGLLCAAGVYAALQLPVAIFPQTDFPRVVIIIDDGVVPAPQVLVSVTRPIEEAMNGIPGVVRIRSSHADPAARSGGTVQLEFSLPRSHIHTAACPASAQLQQGEAEYHAGRPDRHEEQQRERAVEAEVVLSPLCAPEHARRP